MICDEVGGGTEYEECGRELQDERAAGEGNVKEGGEKGGTISGEETEE